MWRFKNEILTLIPIKWGVIVQVSEGGVCLEPVLCGIPSQSVSSKARSIHVAQNAPFLGASECP